ncbi:MAG: CarD family transcriptional regulator, partial [Acidobacteriota bacterium]
RAVGREGDGGAGLPPVLRDMAAGPAAAAGGETEVMEIAYAGGKRLLLPLSRLDQVQKFSGIEGVSPRLDQLGGTSWNRTKSRVKSGMRDMAGELLKLYAERQIARAPAMPPDTDMLHQFEAAFPYEESPDQLEAIAVIKEDLQRERPMDRLLCGDVGYGKTEVAMRAAFKVVDDGYQVAVLAPTTILADQHLETFRKRFSGFPVTIEMISRFRSPQEVATARARGERCLVVVPPAHRRKLEELLEGREVPLGRNGVELVSGELGRGFRLPPAGVVVYGEQQLLAQAKLQRRPSRSRFGPFVSGMRDLKVGDFVVHNDHGIGQFVALRAVGREGDGGAGLPPVLRDMAAGPAAAAGGETEVMEIAYAGGKRLLLPLSRLDQVQKFSGIEGVSPRLDQLGGTSWNRTKSR